MTLSTVRLACFFNSDNLVVKLFFAKSRNLCNRALLTTLQKGVIVHKVGSNVNHAKDFYAVTFLSDRSGVDKNSKLFNDPRIHVAPLLCCAAHVKALKSPYYKSKVNRLQVLEHLVSWTVSISDRSCSNEFAPHV